MAQQNVYLPGYKPSQVSHHEWRNAENSASHLIPHLTRLARESPSLKLLDVGTGSGTIATSFLKYMPPDGHITATDVSEEIIERARSLAKENGLKNITFEPTSVFELPYPDAAFDVVHAHQVLCHLSTPVPALKEMIRVAKPGGIISLRESDLETWSFWPDTAGFQMFHGILTKTHQSAGGGLNTGRRLLSLALEAGCERKQIDMNFAGWSYNSKGDREAFGISMTERLVEGNMKKRALNAGIATQEEIDLAIKGIQTWMEAEDGTLGMMQGEMIITK